jgi:hypothetical protein
MRALMKMSSGCVGEEGEKGGERLRNVGKMKVFP